ncbi:hypothetical protein EVAR_62283_1 [Eumeta japonica]|uniref:Uncharacterized protein n=1 Tax=Eumeta variegata TaxID=151549 RepID=A0A4C1YYN6_EUMVA|nr:hypothetical protein EVAR_62283_1 [Eumeta japonica]
MANFTTERVDQNLRDTLQANAPQYSTGARWWAEFKLARTFTVDDPRSGRLIAVVAEEMYIDRFVNSNRNFALDFDPSPAPVSVTHPAIDSDISSTLDFDPGPALDYATDSASNSVFDNSHDSDLDEAMENVNSLFYSSKL